MDFDFLSLKPKEKKERLKAFKSVFHDYDIRGEYPGEINEKKFGCIANAIVSVLRSKEIFLGVDPRLSSQSLARSLTDTFLDAGVDVKNLGLVTTPFLSWISRDRKKDAVIVTASHNPANENGIKIYSRKKGSIHIGNGLNEIEETAEKFFYGSKKTFSSKERGILSKGDFSEEYRDYLLKRVGKIKTKDKILVDLSNGTTGFFLEKVLDKLKVNFATLNRDPNGKFPGHSPNPLEKSSQANISWAIKKGGYKLGALFDADGDRVVFFDERGNLIPPQDILSLFISCYFPTTSRFKSVVTTASFSKTTRSVAEDFRGRVHVSPVGRTNVEPLMKKKRSLFGVESSGHYFFKDLEYRDDALFALLKVLEVLSGEKKPISKLLEPLKSNFYLINSKINFIEESEKIILRSLKDELSSGGKVSWVDGLTVEFRDWWFNLRTSNTQDVWRLTLEGKDKDVIKTKMVEIEGFVESFNEKLSRIKN